MKTNFFLQHSLGKILKLCLYLLIVFSCVEIYLRFFMVDFAALQSSRKQFLGEVPAPLAELIPRCGWVNRVGPNRSETVALENVWPNGQRASRPQIYKNASRKVLMLGCSFTYGMGLRDRETLAWLLNENFPDVQFDNYGVRRWGAYQCLMLTRYLLEERREKYDQVLYFFIDDHVRRQFLWNIHGMLKLNNYFVICPSVTKNFFGWHFQPSNSFTWFGQDSLASVYFAHTLYYAQNVRRNVERHEQFSAADQRREDEQGWQIVRQCASEMEEVCRRFGAEFSVVTLTGNTFVNTSALKSEGDWPCQVFDVSFPELNEPFYRNHGQLTLHPNYRAQQRWLTKLTGYLQKNMQYQNDVNQLK